MVAAERHPRLRAPGGGRGTRRLAAATGASPSCTTPPTPSAAGAPAAPIGGFGAAEVFSLSPTKVVVAGEGGLVTTNDAGLAEAVRLGRDYGNPGDYDCRFPGLNARMSSCTPPSRSPRWRSSIGTSTVATSSSSASRRAAVPSRAPRRPPGARGPVHLQGPHARGRPRCVRPDRGDAAGALAAEGIDSRRYYAPAHPPASRVRGTAGRAASAPGHRRSSPSQVLTPPLWSHLSDAPSTACLAAVAWIHEHAAAVRGRCSPRARDRYPRPVEPAH